MCMFAYDKAIDFMLTFYNSETHALHGKVCYNVRAYHILLTTL
jgi:hypothetical protein